MADTTESRGLHIYAIFLAFATFLLVIAGGLVTSTGSALAVPDWPLSFGQFFPPMVGGVLFEHGHRLIGTAIGFLTIILAIWMWRSNLSSGVRKLGWWALGIVCAQGVLGGVTVLLKLPAFSSVAHACLGQIFFSLMVCIAVLTGERESVPILLPPLQATKLRRLALMTTGFVFLQLVAGAIYRHTGKAFHVHLLGALLVFVHVILLSRRILSESAFSSVLRTPALTALVLLAVQVGLGWFSWRLPSVTVTTAHVAVGALLLATTAVISVQSYRQEVMA